MSAASDGLRLAWMALDRAAAERVPGDQRTAQALGEAAESYARAKWATQTGPAARRHDSSVVLPFGRAKGVPVHEAGADDLRWVLARVSGSVDDPAKARWRVDNVKLRDAIEAELRTR